MLEADAVWARARGLGGVLFDLDNTLCVFGAHDLPAPVTAHLAGLLAAGVRVGIVSNHPGHGRDAIARALPGAEIGWQSGKPRTAGLRRVLAALEVHPRDAGLVGDRLVTDGWAGWAAGLYTVIVPPVIAPGLDEGLRLRGKRWLERAWIAAAARWPGGR